MLPRFLTAVSSLLCLGTGIIYSQKQGIQTPRQAYLIWPGPATVVLDCSMPKSSVMPLLCFLPSEFCSVHCTKFWVLEIIGVRRYLHFPDSEMSTTLEWGECPVQLSMHQHHCPVPNVPYFIRWWGLVTSWTFVTPWMMI